jgi:hypothetical protein
VVKIWLLEVANLNAVITFACDSLGGGLVALMAVFDQAPFSASALNVQNNNAQDMGNRLATLAKLETYNHAPTVNPAMVAKWH